jgi:hypothetical protein
LLIECSDSSLKKDLEANTKLYASASIPEYRVIDFRKTELVVFNEYQSMAKKHQKLLIAISFSQHQS